MRLLAIATDPSLEVALTMMDAWEVLAVHDVRAASEHTSGVDAMVIGIGSTDDGLAHAEAARGEGIRLPIVVVGDGPALVETEIQVVSRPFSMDDIRAAVERAIAGGAVHRARVQLDQPARAEESEDESDDERLDEPEEPHAEVQPAPIEEPNTAHPGVAHEAADDGPVEEVAPAPEPAPQLIGVIPGDEEFVGIDLAEIEMPAARSEQHAESRAPERVPTADTRPEPVEVAPAIQHVPASEPGPKQTPEPLKIPIPEPAADHPLRPEPLSQPGPVHEHAPVERARRRFGRRAHQPAGPQEGESTLERMLRAAAHGAHAIEALLEEFPIVIDEKTMTGALLREVVEMLSPATAAVYIRDGDVFSIAASFGLSRAERTLSAKPDHPLFAELTINQEALLIAPVDLAQGLVAGIAGTHTNALLAAPITTEGEVIAFLVLGRSDYSEEDLDVCDELAREAGPGLAVARVLSALTARRARDAS